MHQNLDFRAMLNTTRLLTLVITAALFVLLTGCSEDRSSEGPAPLPTIHPDGIPPAKALPPSVGAPGSASDTGAQQSLSEILNEREMYARVGKLAERLSTLGPEGVEEARQLLLNQDDNMGGAENVLLVRYWAMHEPVDAARWAMLRAPLGYRLAVTLPAMEVWAMNDPYEAQLQVEALSMMPNANLIAADMGLIRGWFQSDKPGLEAYIRGLGLGQERQRALRILARQAIKTHGAEWAAKWPPALPDDDEKFKLGAHRQFAIELGKTHVEVAKAFCAAHCDDPKYGDGIMKYVAQNWARRDGAAAMAWVKSQKPGPQRDLAVEWGFTGWLQSNPSEVTEWLESMGPTDIEPWLRPLLEMFAVRRAKEDPLRGLTWAAAIEDDTERSRTMRTIAMNWRRIDPDAADAWLADSPLSEEDRESVRFYGRPKSEIPDTAPAFTELDSVLEKSAPKIE